MGNRLKEEEKIERTIRSLLKLPQNKRCINCNSLGPQYVCTTFFTFVCTNCSGVHREFTHRVKSVSMAKFNSEEVNALQAGGNERARQIYFKEWDPQYHSYPDGSNLHRIRDFIKHVYVDRRFTGERSAFIGERSSNKLPRLRLNNQESDESKKVGGHHASRSFHDDDRYERSYCQGINPGGRGSDRGLRYYYDERRSPRFSQENTRNGGFKRNPLRFEIVDNRIREDRVKCNVSSTGESKVQSKTPDNKKNMEKSHSFVAHPVEEKKLENAPPQIDENSTENQKDADGSAHNQKNKYTGGQDENAVENKIVSLIDFNTDSQPSHAAELPVQHKPPPNNDNNWASFESLTTEKAPQVPNADPLECLLLELSTPSSVPAITASEAPQSNGAPSTLGINNTTVGGVGVSLAAPVEQMPTLLDAFTATTSTNVPAQPANASLVLALPPNEGDTSVQVNDGQQLPRMQQDLSSSISFPADSDPTSQHSNAPVGASNGESSTIPLAPNMQRSFSIPAETSPQSLLKPAEDAASGAGSQLAVETKSSMREELPADLFSARFSSSPAQVSGWHAAPGHGMGYSMQYYPNTAPAPAFPGQAKSTNPFDINDGKSLAHSTHFPSMSSLQGALSNANVSVHPGLMHASSLPTLYSHLKAPQSSTDESMMPSLSPAFATSFSPVAYMGQQQLHNNTPFLRPQGVGSFGRDEAVFGSLGPAQQPFQQPGMRYPALSNSDSFSSMRGNPFG